MELVLGPGNKSRQFAAIDLQVGIGIRLDDRLGELPEGILQSGIVHHRQFDLFGYRPHAVKEDEAAALLKADNRKLMLRIGVAAACMMNIMLFAVAVFSGAGGA